MNTKCCLSLSYYRKLALDFREDGYISTANDITDLVNEIEYLQEELVKAKGEIKENRAELTECINRALGR